MYKKKRRKITIRVTGVLLSVAMIMTSVSCPVYANPIVEEVDIQAEDVWEEVPLEVVEDVKDEVQESAQQYGQENTQESGGWDLNDQQQLEEALRSGSVTLDRNASIAEENVGVFSRKNIIDIAKAEIGVKGRPNKYTYWLGTIGGTYSYAWCQAFASWCGVQAGGNSKVPITASCWQATEWFKDRGLWKSRGSGYVPKAGDYIFFDWGANGGWDHVGIVNYVADGRVYTIEGNTSDMVKGSKSYAMSDVQIIGYGTPKFEDGASDGNLPKGNLDEVKGGKGKIQVAGWAFDWDDPSKTLDILVSVGGKLDSGAPVYKIKANVTRSDVAASYPGCGSNHGFDSVIYVDKTGEQTIYVYVANIGGNSAKAVNQLIGSKTVTIQEAQANEEAGENGNDGNITPTPEPEPITVEKVKKTSAQRTSYNKIKVSWEKVAEADEYEVQVSTDKKFKSNVTTYRSKANTKTITSKTGVVYYFRTRASRTEKDRVYYGGYSGAAYARALPTCTEITSYKVTKKGNVSLWYKKVTGASGYQIVFSPYKNFSAGKKWYRSGGSGKLATGLKKGKTYYFMVRAYRKVDGKEIFGPFSEAKKITIRK